MFSPTVTDHWFGADGAADAPRHDGAHRVVVDPTLPANRRVMVLEPAGGGGLLTVTPEMAMALDLASGDEVGPDTVSTAMDAAGLSFNGADALFYLPVAEQRELGAAPADADVRVLTAADADAFAAFEAAASAEDLDEAFVELDHWLVVGAFADGRLVCASSMYPWAGTRLADTGVLTLPDHRGRGLARRTVREISAHAIDRGFEPQYRCQLDNAASVALAASAGFARFATWDVISDEDDD